MNLLFIDLIAMFMSHKQCNRRQTKKKNAEQSKCRRQRGLTKRTLRPIAKFDLSRWLVTLRLHLKNNPKKRKEKQNHFSFSLSSSLTKIENSTILSLSLTKSTSISRCCRLKSAWVFQIWHLITVHLIESSSYLDWSTGSEMPVAASAIYFLNLRGDVLINRLYRDDVGYLLSPTHDVEFDRNYYVQKYSSILRMWHIDVTSFCC